MTAQGLTLCQARGLEMFESRGSTRSHFVRVAQGSTHTHETPQAVRGILPHKSTARPDETKNVHKNTGQICVSECKICGICFALVRKSEAQNPFGQDQAEKARVWTIAHG